jgi:hypothetical protein
MLARVYLYRGDWINAEVQATSIINSGLYSLTPLASITNTFLSNSNETIWQITRENSNTAEGSQFVPSSATVRPTFALTTYLLNSFEPADQRKQKWTSSNTVSGVTYTYPYKYKQRTIPSGTTPTENNIVFRLAEQYLVRAEARAELNNTAGAINDLNLVRSRAGLAGLSPLLTQSQVRAAVMQERRTEFFAEWGHRWLDLKRTGLADAVLSLVKTTNWQSFDAFFPIPQIEIDRDPFLVQNPGY